MNSNKSSNSGIGIGTVLFLIFLVLKLCNVISWSWWWVTSPLWINFGLALLLLCIYEIIKVIRHLRWKKKYGDKMNYFRKRWR